MANLRRNQFDLGLAQGGGELEEPLPHELLALADISVMQAVAEVLKATEEKYPEDMTALLLPLQKDRTSVEGLRCGLPSVVWQPLRAVLLLMASTPFLAFRMAEKAKADPTKTVGFPGTQPHTFKQWLTRAQEKGKMVDKMTADQQIRLVASRLLCQLGGKPITSTHAPTSSSNICMAPSSPSSGVHTCLPNPRGWCGTSSYPPTHPPDPPTYLI